LKFLLSDPENYSGPLAKQCREFIRQKQALGLKYRTESKALSLFDRYLRDNGAPENALLKEHIVGFAAKRPGESYSNFVSRGTLLRQFGEYMGQMGYASYVLPYYKSHASSFVPYIYTHDEITRIFTQIDKRPRRGTSKYGHKVYPLLFRMLYGCFTAAVFVSVRRLT